MNRSRCTCDNQGQITRANTDTAVPLSQCTLCTWVEWRSTERHAEHPLYSYLFPSGSWFGLNRKGPDTLQDQIWWRAYTETRHLPRWAFGDLAKGTQIPLIQASPTKKEGFSWDGNIFDNIFSNVPPLKFRESG